MNEHQQIAQIITSVWADGSYTGGPFKGSKPISPEEAIAAIEKLLVDARVDELATSITYAKTNPYLSDSLAAQAFKLGIDEALKPLQERIAALTASKSEEKEV